MDRTIVCLCGSARYEKEYREAAATLTLEGKITLTCDVPEDCKESLHPDVHREMNLLHLDKIDLANEVYIVNVNGYIGDSTRLGMAYAYHTGKPIRCLVPLNEAEIRYAIESVPLPVRDYV